MEKKNNLMDTSAKETEHVMTWIWVKTINLEEKTEPFL